MTMFEQPVLTMQQKIYQIFSMFLYKEMTFKISIQDGIKLQYLQVKYQMNNFFGGVYELKIRDSVQLQTAVYDQETDRRLALPSNQRLKTNVRRDQIGTRNCPERIEMGVLVKSKGGNVSVERMGECFQWEATRLFEKELL